MNVLHAVWTASQTGVTHPKTKRCYAMCWWESCACLGWGQKPWKREKLLVRWSILNFAAQVEKEKALQSVEKLLLLVKTKRPPGAELMSSVGGRKTTRQIDLEEQVSFSTSPRLESADWAEQAQFESGERHACKSRPLGSLWSFPAATLVQWRDKSNDTRWVCLVQVRTDWPHWIEVFSWSGTSRRLEETFTLRKVLIPIQFV